MIEFRRGEGVDIRTPIIHLTGVRFRATESSVEFWLAGLNAILILRAFLCTRTWLVDLD